MNKITIISVPVADQQKAKEFYMDKMGFSLIIEAPMSETSKWVQLGLPNTETTITLVDWERSMQPGGLQGLVVSTNNIAEEVAQLQAKGVEMGKIDPTPWGKFCNFKDIDGNGWTLHEEMAHQ